MDLQTIKGHGEAKWAWARAGALIFFLVTGILLVASLMALRAQQEAALTGGPIPSIAAAG